MPRVPLHHPPSFRRHPLTVGRVACKQGTWLAEAALNGGYQGVILCSSEYLEAEQAAKEVENAAALLGQY